MTADQRAEQDRLYAEVNAAWQAIADVERRYKSERVAPRGVGREREVPALGASVEVVAVQLAVFASNSSLMQGLESPLSTRTI